MDKIKRCIDCFIPTETCSEWLQPGLREFFESKLCESNRQYPLSFRIGKYFAYKKRVLKRNVKSIFRKVVKE